MRELDRVAGPPDDRAQARTREEQQAGDRQQHAENRRAGRPQSDRDDGLERAPDGAAVRIAEHEQEARQRDPQTELERTHVDELAPGDDERSEWHQHHGRQVCGRPDRTGHEVGDRAAVEPEPQDRRQEDAQRDEGEADQLRVVMRPRSTAPCAFLHATRRLRGRLVDPPFARHAWAFSLPALSPAGRRTP